MTYIFVGIFIDLASLGLLWIAIYELRNFDEIADDPEGINTRLYYRKVERADQQRAFLFGVCALIVASVGGAVVSYGLLGPH